MPLPENVVAQLGREPAKTQGWAGGIIMFSAGMLFLAAIIWAGLQFGYMPYLHGQLDAVQGKVKALNNSISQSDQAQLVNFYSQTANLQTLLQKHNLTSQLFTWLENNTEANVYYTSFSLTADDHAILSGSATSEADVNQQISIFENSPEVLSANVSNVTAPLLPGQPWTFRADLTMNPSLFLASGQSAAVSSPVSYYGVDVDEADEVDEADAEGPDARKSDGFIVRSARNVHDCPGRSGAVTLETLTETTSGEFSKMETC